jgi:hypothetical protein
MDTPSKTDVGWFTDANDLQIAKHGLDTRNSAFVSRPLVC